MKRVPGLLLLVLASVAASDARAWTPIDGSQPTWSGTVPYSLNDRGSADLGGFGPTEAVVREGMEDWTRLTCTSLTVRYDGASGGVPFSGGVNVIGWYESGWVDDPNAIGVTGPRFTSGGQIIDAQMAMNGVNFTWTTDPGSGYRVNAYSIVLHEGGHYYGLGHSADGASTMYYAYSGGVSRLNGDDQAGICALYPGSGGGAIDCSVSGCPPGQTCVDGRCVEPRGDGRLCAACSSDLECAGAGARCLRYPDGGGYCGPACARAADCGTGGGCEAVSDGTQQCVRRNAAGDADCTSAPEPPPPPEPDCRVDADCAPGQRCDTASGTCVPVAGPPPECATDGECAVGERCETSTRTCEPAPAGALGDDCATNDDCASGMCATDSESGDSFCTVPCAGTDECPSGFECASVDGVASACRPTRGGLGDACEGPGDCLGGLCAQSGGGDSYCTRVCEDRSSCPGLFDCVEVVGGATHVCARTAGTSSRVLYGSCSASPGRPASDLPVLMLMVGFLGLVRSSRRRRY